MHAKFYPFSKFRGLMPEQWTLFLDFENSRLPLKKYPLFRENGYERGIRFGRKWRGRGVIPSNPHALSLQIRVIPANHTKTRFWRNNYVFITFCVCRDGATTLYVSVNKTCCHISIARHQRCNIPKHLIIWFCCLSVYPSICRHTITPAFTEVLLELYTCICIEKLTSMYSF